MIDNIIDFKAPSSPVDFRQELEISIRSVLVKYAVPEKDIDLVLKRMQRFLDYIAEFRIPAALTSSATGEQVSTEGLAWEIKVFFDKLTVERINSELRRLHGK